MVRNSAGVSKPAFHTPMRFDWTDEKLRALSQEQLLNLLENLDHQRSIGRLSQGDAATIDQRITSLLTSRNSVKRRKQLAEAAAVDAIDEHLLR